MKKFLTVRDIEDMAGEGSREVVLDADTVITAAARDRAADLRMAVREPEPWAAAPKPAPAAPASPAPAAAPPLASPPPARQDPPATSIIASPSAELVAEITRRVMAKLQSRSPGT